jgi:hypothetical protein
MAVIPLAFVSMALGKQACEFPSRIINANWQYQNARKKLQISIITRQVLLYAKNQVKLMLAINLMFHIARASPKAGGRSPMVAGSLLQPEKLLREAGGIRVGTRRAGNVGKCAGDGWRGLQAETGIGPAQHQVLVQRLPLKINQRQCGCGRILDRKILVVCPVKRLPGDERIAVSIQGDARWPGGPGG